MPAELGSVIAAGKGTLIKSTEATELVSAGQTPLFVITRYCTSALIPFTLKIESVFAGAKLDQFVLSPDRCQLTIFPMLPVNVNTVFVVCPKQTLTLSGLRMPPTDLGSTMIIAAVLVSMLHALPFWISALYWVVVVKFCAV